VKDSRTKTQNNIKTKNNSFEYSNKKKEIKKVKNFEFSCS